MLACIAGAPLEQCTDLNIFANININININIKLRRRKNMNISLNINKNIKININIHWPAQQPPLKQCTYLNIGQQTWYQANTGYISKTMMKESQNKESKCSDIGVQLIGKQRKGAKGSLQRRAVCLFCLIKNCRHQIQISMYSDADTRCFV